MATTKAKPTKARQVSIRLEDDVMTRLEALAEKMGSVLDVQDFRMSTTSVLRLALMKGLETLEHSYAAASPGEKDPDSGRRKPSRK